MAVRLPTLNRTPDLRLLVGRARLSIGKTAGQLWSRAQRTTKVARARAGYAAGVATTAWGVGVQFGLGWALMAGGIVTSISFLLLYPVDGSP